MHRSCLSPAARSARLVTPADPERGSTSLGHLLKALAIIAVVGIIILAITNYASQQTAGLV